MAHRGICPDLAFQRIEIEKGKQKSERAACKVVAEELGVPFKTVHSWCYRAKSKVTANAVMPLSKLDTCTVSDLQRLIDIGKKYATVYADPPWKYSNQATRSATDNHYSTMTVDDIMALPISELAEKNAHLHLWTTNAFLFEALKIIEAWGFQYKSCFVWVKPQMGIGNYWRVSHEFLLFGLKGHLPFQDKSQKSWLKVDRTTHSEKPERIRTVIEKVSPSPYLELFGRRIVKGWTVWGNEIKKDIFYNECKTIDIV